MSSALLHSHETSRDTSGRNEPGGARHDDEPTRPVRDRVDVDFLLEPDPPEEPSRSDVVRRISGVLD